MPQIQISDQLYQDAQRRSVEAGVPSVDEYVAVVLSYDLNDATPNLNPFFTPERLALIDQSLADVQAGDVLTMDQAKAELANARQTWLRDHPGAK